MSVSTYPIPTKLTGSALEKLVLARAKLDEARGRYTLSRYGVMATLFNGKWQPITSLPDFEGVWDDGRQFILEAKVCSAASFPLADDHFRKRQFSHMWRRARFGVQAYILIHWNERALKTKTEPAVTTAFPVADTEFWREYEAGNQRSISRAQALQDGVVIPWNPASTRTRVITPDLGVLRSRA